MSEKIKLTENLKAYGKEYRSANKERLDGLKKQEYECANCGRIVQHCNKTRHEATSYCKSRTKQQPQPVDTDETVVLMEMILQKINELQNIINAAKK